MTPKIYEQDGYKLFFYSNEHEPIHVHVRYGGGEAVFEVSGSVTLRESRGMKVQELAKAERIVAGQQQLIQERWNEHRNR